MVRWARKRKGYIGVSWGKDSVCLAHMATQLLPEWPLVMIRHQLTVPELLNVRNAFLATHKTARYFEIKIDLTPNDIGGFHLKGSYEKGFRKARQKFGDCHMSGVRGQESRIRALVRKQSGGENKFALAPLIDWTVKDVWGYLALHDLPISPTYAMNFAGQLDRDRLRIADLTFGTEIGDKQQWEHVYYPEFTEWV